MTWYTEHIAKIEQARALTDQGRPAEALIAIDEAGAIRQGREQEREEASRQATDLLHPQKVNEALDFSLPEQAELGAELLWVVNYVGALRVNQATLERGG